MMFRFKCKCGWTINSEKSGNFTCHICGELIKATTKSRGLGDTIHKITTALHIPHCGGCEQRRQALNKLVPYKS